MRRGILFFSSFLLSLWIVLSGTFLLLLLPNAPSVPKTPFASVSIRTEQNSTIYLPNRIFTCTETAQQFQCQAELQNRLLDLNLTKGKEYQYDFSSCLALYGGQAVSCQDKGLTYAPILSQKYEITNLGLSPQQLRAVQQEYWDMNALVELGELRLLWLSSGLALAAGMIAVFFTWLYPGLLSKGFASLASGYGMNQLVWGALGHVQYDVVTPYGFTPDTWGWVVKEAATLAGILTMLTTALLLGRRLNCLSKILLSISTSAGIFSLCRLSISRTSYDLLTLFGLTDTFSQHQYLQQMWFTTAISVLVAIAAAILLWRHTNQSLKRFLCLGCGLGAITLASYLLQSVLLGLGYVD